MNIVKQFAISGLIFFNVCSCHNLNTSSVLATEYHNLGNAYFEIKKYSEAARAYKIALSFQPDLQIAKINMVRSLAEQGDVESALTFLDSLLEQNKDNLNLLKIQAYLFYIKGERQKSWSLWSELAAQLPGDPDTRYNAALAAFDQKEFDQALELLQGYELLDSKRSAAYFLLGDLWHQKKDWKKSEAAYRKVLALEEKNIFAQKALAESLIHLEHYGDAVKAYLSCIDLLENQSEDDKKKINEGLLLFQVAKIQLQVMENYEEAWKNFKKAQEKGNIGAQDWQSLLGFPDLYERIRLQADLKLANIYPEEKKPLRQSEKKERIRSP